MKRVLLAAAGIVVLAIAPASASAAPQAGHPGPPVRVTEVPLAPGGLGLQTITVGRMAHDELPDGMVAAPNGRDVFVLNTGAQDITEVPSNFAPRGVRSIHLAAPPTNAVITPNGKLLYVVVWGSPGPERQPGSVAVVRISGFRLIKYIEVPFASDIAMAPNGRTAYVASWVNGRAPWSLTPIRVATNTAGRAIPLVSYKYLPVAVAVTPDSRTVYVLSEYSQPGVPPGAGILTAVRAATRTVLRRIKVGSVPMAMAIAPRGRTVYVTSESGLIAVSARTNTAAAPINVGLYPDGLAIAPDGKTVYVANSQDQIVPVSTGSGTIGSPVTIPPGEFDGDPGTMVVSPLTRNLYALIDVFSGKPGILQTINTAASTDGAPIPVSPNPTQVVLAPGGRTAFVLSY